MKREIIADIHTFGDAITEIQALITQREREARADELTLIALEHWQKPIPEQAVLSRIAELKEGDTDE